MRHLLKKALLVLMLSTLIGLPACQSTEVYQDLVTPTPIPYRSRSRSQPEGDAPLGAARTGGGMQRVLITYDRSLEGPPRARAEGVIGSTVESLGGQTHFRFTIVPVVAATVSEAGLDELRRNPDVVSIEPDFEVYALDEELDNSWGVKKIGAGTVHATNKGDEVKVGVLDTGIDYDHPDLDGNYVTGYDFAYDDADPMDYFTHGTHVAGIIAAEDNGAGVVGVAPEASLYAVKVLDDSGYGITSWVIAGIEWAVTNELDVINMSIGFDGYSSALCDAVQAAYEADITVACAVGNAPSTAPFICPANCEYALAVGAVDSDDERASFSRAGPQMEVTAPGVLVNSTVLDDGYGALSGTSMAAPHVAGLAALLYRDAWDEEWCIWDGYEDEVTACTYDRIREGAVDLGDAGWDEIFGWGRIDAVASTTISITHDMAMTALEVTSDIAVPKGDPISFKFTTRNWGPNDATGIGLWVYDVTDSSTLLYLSNLSYDAGETKYSYLTWYTTSASVNSHNIRASIHQQGDDVEANNTLYTTVFVMGDDYEHTVDLDLYTWTSYDMTSGVWQVEFLRGDNGEICDTAPITIPVETQADVYTLHPTCYGPQEFLTVRTYQPAFWDGIDGGIPDGRTEEQCRKAYGWHESSFWGQDQHGRWVHVGWPGEAYWEVTKYVVTMLQDATLWHYEHYNQTYEYFQNPSNIFRIAEQELYSVNCPTPYLTKWLANPGAHYGWTASPEATGAVTLYLFDHEPTGPNDDSYFATFDLPTQCCRCGRQFNAWKEDSYEYLQLLWLIAKVDLESEETWDNNHLDGEHLCYDIGTNRSVGPQEESISLYEIHPWPWDWAKIAIRWVD